ncbi:MAG: ABC transporter ATP-binding protein, partial [Paludibacteraceae bacterium]
GIIGKNGAGKSTLLKLLSKVTAPTTGTIRARGRIASLLEVGTGFHGEMTGRENIYMNGAILGMTKQEIAAKLDEIVDFSGCERYIDTPVKRYSSGMMVRLGFAVAAHLDPEILVVDEVLAVGDAEFQKKAIGKMKDVSQGEGRTVLFVSHNMTSIRQLCKSGVLLENGLVSFKGTAEQTIERYMAVNMDDIGKPLRERTDRIGNGRIRFTNVLFKNINGVVVEEAFVGQFLKVEIYFDVNDLTIDPKRLILACGISDAYGVTVVNWVSDELNHQFSNFRNGCISLEIPQLNLRPAVYNFGIQISEDSTAQENFCDALVAKKLSVLNDDFFAKGMNLKECRGHMAFVPGNFD